MFPVKRTLTVAIGVIGGLLDGVLARLPAGSPSGRGLRGRARRADT